MKGALNHSLRKIKRLLVPRLDIPFSRDESNRYLPWFIALMVFLTGIFLAGGVTVGEIANHKRADISQWLTIQIPAVENSQKLADQVMVQLRKIPEATKIKQQSRAEIARIVAPWFGTGEMVEQLPLPTLIDVKWQGSSEPPIQELKQSFAEISPLIELDDHPYWLEHYLKFILLLEGIAYILALLIISITVMMIVFISKTALKLHEDAVWLLHSVGAVDNYIAKQFQFNAFLLGTRGALMGTALSAIVFFMIGFFTSQFHAPLLPSLPITSFHILIWLLLPLVTGFLAMAVTRHTVLGMLRKMA
jgi:cell division transport system permease protein